MAGSPSDRLASGPPLVLDGATGTELERRGVRAGLPLWSTHALLEAPGAVEEIHAAYVEAGADALTANTFRTQRRTLARAGLGERAAELTAVAVDLTRRAAARAERRVWILGSAPPLEDCYRPELTPDPAALDREHAEHAENLAAAEVDAVLAETHATLREACAAVRAAGAVGLPAVVCFQCDARARLPSGEPLEAALEAVAALGAAAVGVNCLPPPAVPACLPLLSATGRPFGVYPNLGAPGDGPDAPRVHQRTPAELAREAEAWLAAGARFVGGCCGTTPEHVRILASLVSRRGTGGASGV